MADKLGSYESAFYTLGSVIVFASFLPFILLCLPPTKAKAVLGPERVDITHQGSNASENSGMIEYCFVTSMWFVSSTFTPQIKTHFQIFWYPSANCCFPEMELTIPELLIFVWEIPPQDWDPVNHRMWPWGGGLGRLWVWGEGGVWVSVQGCGAVGAGRVVQEMGALYMTQETRWATKNYFIPTYGRQ